MNLRLTTLVWLLLLAGCCKPRPHPFMIQAASPSLADVLWAINQAQDGDTVSIPPGTASWTKRLEINKSITLQGQTTVIGAGTANAVVDPNTLITDETDQGVLRLCADPSKPLRVTGIAFKYGTRTTSTKWSIMINPSYSTPATKIRVDHCSFDQLKTSVVIGNEGWCYPVIDHNVIDYKGGYPFLTDQNSYGGKTNGNGAWNDYAWFGSDKFFFIETNTIRNMGTAIKACLDTTNGSRTVFRYNYVHNGLPADHGTEGQEARYDRCREIYNNEFNFVGLAPTNISVRGGNLLLHDNLSTGLRNSSNVLCNIGNNRTQSGRSESVWGQADGTSPWDENDTEGNGTFVEGHAPYVFEQGTATGGSVTGGDGHMTDTTKNWRLNQWVDYSIQDTASYMPHLAAYITSNTSNTITYAYYTSTDTKRHLVFTAGTPYKIHRCLRQFDMPGTGRGDLVSGAPPINTAWGKAWYPHYVVEPSFSWNNRHESGIAQSMKSKAGQGWITQGRDYYELGLGFTGTPQIVKDKLTAATNGVQYSDPYVYPHPLVSGGGAPSPIPTASSVPSPTATRTPAPTPQPTAIWTPTSTPIPTATLTPIVTTPTPTATAPATATAFPSPSPTPSFTSTPPPGIQETPPPEQGNVATPGNLTARVVQGKRVQLSWVDNSTSEEWQELVRSLDNCVTWEVATVVRLSPDQESYVDGTTAKKKTYCYRVRACQQEGCSEWSNVITITP